MMGPQMTQALTIGVIVSRKSALEEGGIYVQCHSIFDPNCAFRVRHRLKPGGGADTDNLPIRRTNLMGNLLPMGKL